MEAIENNNITSRHYYDNEILGNLIFYENLQKDEF